MTRHGIAGFWPEFVASVNEQNAFLAPGALRRYQADLLEAAEFSVISPFSGKPVTTRTGAHVRSGQLAYFFPGQENLWLLTPERQFKAGYPLTQAVMGDDARRHFLFNRTRQPEPISPEQLTALNEISGRALTHRAKSATLIVGHENFAHHIWNELPALQVWLERTSDDSIAKLSIIATAEPLGPLLEIFPTLEMAMFRRSSGAKTKMPLCVRVGSQLVTAKIRRTVLDYFKRRKHAPAILETLSILDTGWPRIWISVRQKSRTPDNQFEFLLATLKSIISRYPDAMFVLDGFSFPVGFFEDERTQYLRDTFIERSQDASRFIDTLRDRIAAELGGDFASRICDVSGHDLADAVCVAGNCDYYVCHGGTLQHKIGWFYSTPGFIHAAPQGLAHFLKQAQQAEGSAVPDLLPSDLAVATSRPVDVHRVPDILRNANYRIVDVELAAEAILASMTACLRRNP